MTAIRNGGIYIMEKKNIDWSNIGFGYMPTDYRYVSNCTRMVPGTKAPLPPTRI